jgi:hypothetical protein
VHQNGTFNNDCLPCSHGAPVLEHVMCFVADTATGPVVVDNHDIPIVPYFLLSILQLALMIIFNDGCMVAIAWDRGEMMRVQHSHTVLIHCTHILYSYTVLYSLFIIIRIISR